METIDLKENCKKEKKLFYSMSMTILIAFAAMFFIFAIQKSIIDEKENLINAFSNNLELICSSKIVSMNNGYRFDEKKKGYITNDSDIFFISNCRIK